MLRRTFSFLLFVSTLGWPAEFPTEANIRYDRYPETVLDILQPRDPALKKRPAVIVIHGGGWVNGTKESMVERFCVSFLERGFVVANVEYRLAKVALAPAAVTDVLTAAKWFSDHAEQYKVDPKKIIVTGRSAGGHLSLMVGMLPKDTDLGPVTRIAAVVNFYGITDVGDQLDGPHMRSYAVTWLPEQPGRMELANKLSPLTYVRKNLPPILTLHGDADQTVPYEHGVRLTNALKEAGVKTELITVPAGKHGFTPEQMNELWPQIFKFLKKYKLAG
jgi:acetyl esterase/lipase